MVIKPQPATMPRPPERLRLPVAEAPTSREIERRRALALRVLALRSEIGPIPGHSMLVEETRSDEDR